MKRIGTILWLCVLLGFGLSNGAWAFNKKPALPSSKQSSDTLPSPLVLNVTEDVTARTLHSKRWRTEDGSSYTEIHPGLHVLSSGSTYKNADPTLIATPDGAEAKQLSHPVRFKSELSYGRPTVEQGDRKNPVLQASPALIVYRDLKTDRSVVLARSKPASLSFEKNIATYKDAFDYLRADVRYTVRAGNLEQDVLLYEKPLKPSDYGLNDETTVLAVMTQVFSLEDQVQSSSTIKSPHQTLAQSASDLKTLMTPRIAGPIVLEQDGKAIQQFARSYVFSKNSKQPVHKRLVTVQGIHFLTEESPATYFQKQELPVTAQSPKVSQHIPFTQLEVLANANFTPETKDRLALVRPTLIKEPIVIDFISVTGTIATDFTFAQGETYLVDGPVTMTGLTTFEGGATIKFNVTGSLDVSNPVFNTTSSNWLIFTSQNDDSVGEVVTGSTGSPSSYPNALTLAKGSVRFVQIRYADDGIIFPGNETLTVQDSEFLAVGTPVDASSSTGPAIVNLNNLLIAQGTNGPVLSDDGTNVLTVTANNITMADLTGDGISNTTTAAGSSLSVTDSLLVDIQGTSVFEGTAPTAEDFNAFFQTPQNGTGVNDIILSADPILTDFFLDQASPVIDAGSQSSADAGLYHYNTNTDGTIEGPTTVDIGYHLPPSISQFSVLATNSIWLKSNSMVSGDIGVNEATTGPFLDSNVALAVGHDMIIPAAINLRADSIKIKTGAVINGNVYHNQLENNGTINGATLTPMAFPILDVLPLFRTATLGTVSDIDVAAGTTHVLVPGDYGVITVNDNATLQFTGGLYQIQKIDAKKTTSLLFDAPSEVRIVENLVTKRFSTLGASAGVTLSAGDIQFFVEGADVGATLAVEFGHTHTVLGHFYAPNGTLSLKRLSTFSGIFLAKDVMIGHDAVVVLDPGTGQPIVAAPVIQPNGGSFFDSVQVSLSTITSGATIHYTIDGSTPTTASPVFTTPFTLTTNATPQTVKAIAVRTDYLDSSISSADFTIQAQPVAQVAISPASGTFQDFVFITMTTTTPGAEIFYTTDGSDPTEESTLYEFAFSLSESATVRAIAIKEGFANSPIVGETYTIQTSPAGTNQLVGRLLDTNSLINDGIEIPVVGATISLLNTPVTAVSGADGNFILNNVPLGIQILDIDTSTANLAPDSSTYAGFREKIDVLPGINVVNRPFFMPRIDASSLTTIDPLVDTLVVNPNLGASLLVMAGTALDEFGNPFTGQLSISEVPAALAPAALPETLEPGLLVTIQPVGVTFSTPAPLTLPNVDQFSVNAQNEYNIWSLDPESGTFIVVGMAQVSADGTQLETVSGGIIAADWHHSVPVMEAVEVAGSSSNGGNHDPNNATKCKVGSLNVVQTGELMVEHDLVTYRSFGINRNLKFVYDSLAADARPIVSANATNSVRNTVPPTISTTVELNGEDQGDAVFINTAFFSESADESLRVVRQLDATSLPTGRYPYRLKITNNYLRSRISSFINGNVLVNNEQNSPYGAGWTLAGVQNLHVQPDGSAVITDGTGGSQVFEPEPNDVSEGLVGYWPFEDGSNPTADVTGNHPGTLVGPIYSTDAAPIPDNTSSLSFSQNRDYVEVAHAPDLTFSAPNPTSMSIWFKAAVRDNVMHMIGKRAFCGGTGVNYQFVFTLGDFYSLNNSTGGTVLANQDAIINQWMHMAYSYDGTRLRLYIDGVLKNDVPFNWGSPNSAPLFIGDASLSCNAPDSWEGKIDEVRIYNRALSDIEVSTLAGKDTSGTLPDGGILFASPQGDFSQLIQNPDGTLTRTMKNGTKHNFDATGLHTSTVDRNGNTTRYLYDPADLLTKIIDPTEDLPDPACPALGVPAQGVTCLSYTAGKLSSIIDPAGRETQFIIDANGDLTRITDPDGSFRVFGYDTQHHLTLQKSKRGFDTTYNYDFSGRNTGSILPDTSTRQMVPVQAVGLVDPASGTGTLTNPATVVRPTEAFASFTDGNGNVNKFEVDQFGKATMQADPLTRTSDIIRDADGNPTQVTSPSGAVQVNTFDSQGNLLTSTQNFNNATTTMTYDSVFNNITSITDPENNLTTLNYDANGNLIETIDAAGTKTAIEYTEINCPGQPTFQKRAVGLPEETTLILQYDPVTCNLVTTIDHLNFATTLEHDSAGNIIKTTDAKLRTTRMEYDALGRLIASIDPSNTDPSPVCATSGVTCFTYDAQGNLETLLDARGKINLFEYDTIDQTIKRTDPLGNFVTFQYDGNGNLRFQTDRKNQVTEGVYDAAHQLIQRILLPGDPAEEITTFTYNALGNTTSATDADSALTWGYDLLGRLTSASTTGSASQPDVTITYTYDKNNQRLTMDDGVSAIATDYAYDTLNRLTSLTNPSGQAFGFDYDVLSRRKKLTYPNGITTDYSYDVLGQLLTLSHTLPTDPINPARASFSYTYDGVGSRDTLTTARSNVAVAEVNLTYLYDNLNRLTQATRPLAGDPDETFQYDPVGNRLSQDGQVVNSVFDDSNHLLEDSQFTYVYDLSGNLAQKTDKASGEVTDYTWDVRNLLVKVELSPSAGAIPTQTVQYRYDATGKRILKDVDGTISKYIYDNANILLEYNGANVLQARFTPRLGIDEPLVMNRSGVDYFFHADSLGSITELTNSAGTIDQSYVYDSFGNVNVFDQNGAMISIENGIINPFAYTGREFDIETGLYYYRARYFDSNIGRFLSEDPIGFGGGNINLYGYVHNSPLNFIDPLGLWEGIFPGQGPSWHHNRNTIGGQICPPEEPQPDNEPEEDNKPQNQTDDQGEGNKDWKSEGRSSTHGNQKSYRGLGPNFGFQCVYDDNGDIVRAKEFEGTYDYSPPYTDMGSIDPLGVIGHVAGDVAPWIVYGN